MIDEKDLSSEYLDYFKARRRIIEKKFSKRRINTYFCENIEDSRNQIYQLITKFKRKDGVTRIGFADSVGRASTNLSLSQKRAEAVQELLLSKGVSQVEVAGFGEAMPVADNGSDSGRSMNRRVEIWLKRN